MTTRDVRLPGARPLRITPILQYLVAIVVRLIVLVPLVTAVINGFKSNADLLLRPFGLPRVWVWAND